MQYQLQSISIFSISKVKKMRESWNIEIFSLSIFFQKIRQKSVKMSSNKKLLLGIFVLEIIFTSFKPKK